MIEYRTLRVALLGAGSVGSQVAAQLIARADELASRAGAGIELAGIAVRDLDAPRDADLPRELLTTDPHELILSSDIVVELMGGIESARTLILEALGTGADVVTANKALLAAHGPELFAAAEQVGAQLHYEAAVAGAIPIIRPLRDSLAGDRVQRILGIVNGTTNYILDEMHTKGLGLEDALAVATELGYAEADPTADIEGHDAAAKAAILAGLAFHTTVPLESVHCEGITAVTAEQIESAKQAGYVVKLLAICEQLDSGVSARVHPALVPAAHPLASVHGANNAVFVQAEAAGDLMFYGAGAGASRPPARCWATSSRSRGGTSPAGRASRSRPARPWASRPSAASRPATRSRSRSRTGRACWLRSPGSSTSRASRSRPCCSRAPPAPLRW
ncbi:hypothetical protein GCM10025874_01460 [Arenivirga flava]|uniref:Homoserine dehydrogenase n=1 Tax=Arenivirga flava TaxID=1930060 RepID=A0AA37X9P1_9MICO|nr:hypothetical protein GCM10025874_01460 [Arenivirga flava]